MTNFLQKYLSFVGQVNYIFFLILVALLPFPQIFLRSMAFYLVNRGTLLSKKQYTRLAEHDAILNVWRLVSMEINFWSLGR